jgi:hypothetical protein
MAQTIRPSTSGERSAASDRSTGLTRGLLACAIAAGPLYIVVGSIEALTRPGFDPTREDLSLLSNGAFGWVHIALLVVTGLLTIAGGVGMRRALAGGRGALWGPLLVGLYGVGLIGAGIFIADPARGFPPGTPADAHAVSWHGLMHFISGGVGFLGLIAACMVFARRFVALKQKGWATYSVLTGVLFFAAFVGIASGSQQGGSILVVVTLAFTVAVILGWAWISAIAAGLVKASVA